jgi:hypothetical protein
MRKTIILALAFTGFTLSPITASATDDSKYPAYDFQPKIVYIDKEAVEKSAPASEKPAKKKVQFDPKYPAAYFEPKVIYP